jgi:hypothetical protein
VEPTRPSSEAHCATAATLNAFGPGYSDSTVKVEQPDIELQELSLDASSVEGFTQESSFDLTAGSNGRPQLAVVPTRTTTEPIIELHDDGVVVETFGQRIVYTAEERNQTPKRRRKEQTMAQPDRLPLYRCRRLEFLPGKLKSETSKRPGKASCGVVLLPYATPTEELGGRLLIGHWVAFFCEEGVGSSCRLLFVDGQREVGGRVHSSLSHYMANPNYSGEARYRLCE